MFSSLKQKALDFLEPYKQKDPATYAAAEQAIGGILIADGIFGTVNPLGGKKRPGIFGTIGGMFVGVVCILIAVFGANLSGVNSMTATTTATVVSVSVTSSSNTNGNTTNSCSLVASYSVNGTEYTKQSSDGSSSYCGLSQGEAITINYNPAQPGSYVYGAKDIKLTFEIFLWLGPIVIIVSLFTFFVRLFSIIFGWKLLRDGRKNAAVLSSDTGFQTIVDEIKKNFTSQVFGFGGNDQTAPPPSTDIPNNS